jgi:carboxyl-terminal processing protease
MAPAISRAFFDRRATLGTMKLRAGEFRMVVFPEENGAAYKGPLVILTDEASLSTSEILAGGLQENGRATVVGRRTGGMVLPSQVEALPGGARLQYVFADFKTPKGVLLEGRGVLPDVPVSITRRALLDGHDPTLDAALAVIARKKVQ